MICAPARAWISSLSRGERVADGGGRVRGLFVLQSVARRHERLCGRAGPSGDTEVKEICLGEHRALPWSY